MTENLPKNRAQGDHLDATGALSDYWIDIIIATLYLEI